MKTHFADIVAEENELIKNKVYEEFETEQLRALARKEHSEKVKKPKIDPELKAKLENEIKNPTTFIGRQSAHADMIYSLNGNNLAVPKSNYLSAQRQSLPDINSNSNSNSVSKYFSAGRNSVQVVPQSN